MDIKKLTKNFKFSFAKTETHFQRDSQAYQKLAEAARGNQADIIKKLESSVKGLNHKQVSARIKQYGYNVVSQEKVPPWYMQLFSAFRNPFIILLLVLAFVSYLTGDMRATIVMILMVILSVALRFVQEYRSSKAAEKLKSMVRTTCTVLRCTTNINQSQPHEVRLKELVPGDIVLLNAGDLIPADVRILESRDLFVSQAVLTGESVPAEKHADLNEVSEKPDEPKLPHENFNLQNICYMGTNVVSGTATAIVVSTGSDTYFGSLAREVVASEVETSFDKGINRVSFLLIRFMLVMVPAVFLLNGLTKGNWTEAFFFAVSVAVGITPEMLPMIVTTNLAKGAMDMSKKKVVVKHLSAIQNFGAMDILCTDKTGTLTQDKIVLKYYQDVHGRENPKILEYCFMNSYYQTGLQNLLDKAILVHHEYKDKAKETFKKIDEIPFDFERRMMSVVVETEKQHVLICKGAAEEIMNASKHVEIENRQEMFNHDLKQKVRSMEQHFNEQGFRVIGIAYKKVPEQRTRYTKQDESGLTFLGFLAFLDPPKETAAAAITALKEHGITIKILTGDNDIVTKKICSDVGLIVDRIVLGEEIEAITDEQLRTLSEKTTVFARLSPMQKARVVQSLRSGDHTIGYMGDGINDAPSLKQADIGISVDSAVDIAKESADIILLEKSLLVLKDGVAVGRVTFGNTMKYLKATASSNFGNVFSVLGSSVLLPFLPMKPIHLLIQNLLYDISQAAIPTDSVDADYVKKPRKWHAEDIGRFMLFIGPISSIFDYATFALMWFVFHANTVSQAPLFQSGWFIEGLLTQTIIVHLLRTKKVPFIESNASIPLILTTILIIVVGIVLPFTPLGLAVGLVGLPGPYFFYLTVMLIGYCVLTQLIKQMYISKFQSWL